MSQTAILPTAKIVEQTPVESIEPQPRFPIPFRYKATNPEYKSLIADKLTRQWFMKHIGFELNFIAPGYMEGQVDMSKTLEQQDGFFHGGVTATVADIVTGFAAFSLVHRDDRVVTSDLKISYFSPGRGNQLFARGWVIKQGSRLMYCEAEMYSIEQDQPLLIAKAYGIMAVIAGKNR